MREIYPPIDQVMGRMQEGVDAGLDPEEMLSWALGQVGKIKSVRHREAAVGKVKEFWGLCNEKNNENL